jgi:hypothetical protein
LLSLSKAKANSDISGEERNAFQPSLVATDEAEYADMLRRNVKQRGRRRIDECQSVSRSVVSRVVRSGPKSVRQFVARLRPL